MLRRYLQESLLMEEEKWRPSSAFGFTKLLPRYSATLPSARTLHPQGLVHLTLTTMSTKPASLTKTPGPPGKSSLRSL
ncbi:Hypothetical protein FKW44_023905 [Caligus rogercresseyi]|uniref:Uncharacterized protein n=1 Tax=Caligus rogercresseyi TaxID=217165 RepID=A0A7T8GPP1_CALRO|nr:Hypothetical protein FKW44_023905 [Caligus rogercresseyi]